MRKILCILLVLVPALAIQAQQKYALVIGNGAYTNVTRLNNPVNDANDMAAALQGLGFTVDKVLNGTQEQMETAAIRLKNRLSGSKNTYGFFFYAGHGVQSNGENYLIPTDANIQSESFLRTKVVSVQAVLDALNQAGNTLNIVVLDACRDNPFSWKRSGTRGLQTVSGQPADSIIVYATSAGSTAADGTGRNGLFTTHLLNNLKAPGLEVSEVFRRTGGDVSRASGGSQRPAVYNQFYGTAYLAGVQPAPSPAPSPRPAPTPTPSPSPAVVPPQPSPVPVQPKPKLEGDYNTLLAKGQEYFDEKYLADKDPANLHKAIEYYEAAYSLDPQDYVKSKLAFAYQNRSLIYSEKKEYDNAIAELNQAIRLDPSFTMAYNSRGVAYFNKKEYDNAIADFNRALRSANHAPAYNNRGVVYKNKKEYDNAIADFNQAIRFAPNDSAKEI